MTHRDPWPELQWLIRMEVARINREVRARPVDIDDADYETPLTDISRSNIECRIEWRRRSDYQRKYPDQRGDLTGPTLDEDYEMKRSVARALLGDILMEKIERTERANDAVRKATNVFFLRQQAN